MIIEIKKIIVFIKRDFKILFTYRLAFSIMFFNLIFNLFYFILFGSMFGQQTPSHLAVYQQNFITYLFIGSIGWSFLWSVMSSSSMALRNEMMIGTIESILLSSTKISTLIIAYTLYGCIMGFISIVILLSIGLLIFDVSVTINAFTLCIFLFSTFMMAGFGMIFSGLTLWMKNIGTTIPLLQNISMLFSGVYFPITVLPEFFQQLSKFIPFYYSIEGIRISIINPSSSMKYIYILSPITIIIILIGLGSLKYGLHYAKKNGSISFY